MNIKWIGSPNSDSNRIPIDRIIIHWMAGDLRSADATFQRYGGTSAHYGVEDDTVHQYVYEDRVAYHCGNYFFNQRSFGIEHSAAPGRNASEKTYQTSGRLIYELCVKYGIPMDRAHIIGHNQVVPTQCPGTLDIDKLIRIARSHLEVKPSYPPNVQTPLEKKTYDVVNGSGTSWNKYVKLKALYPQV